MIRIAVCGAHLRGFPLNHELIREGGVFVREDRTAPCYRMFVLSGGRIAKPGLVRAGRDDVAGGSIDVEVWELPDDGFGRFVAGIPSPLGIGKLELLISGEVSGFLCEGHALAGAEEITALGGWRAFTGSGPA